MNGLTRFGSSETNQTPMIVAVVLHLHAESHLSVVRGFQHGVYEFRAIAGAGSAKGLT